MNNTSNNQLSECRACSGTVSKTAKACPHCGQKKPYKAPLAIKRIILYSFAGFLIWALMQNSVQINKMSEGANTNFSNPSRQQNWILQSQDGVRNKLKDGKSAQFRDSFFVVWKGTPVVCGYVNAKNSFGGMGGYQRFIASGENRAYLEEQVTDFENVWQEMCRK